MGTTNDSVSRGASFGVAAREGEWRRRFVGVTLAWLLFECATGLAVTFLPFSVPAQWTVVMHTVVGLLFLPPVAVYLAKHLASYYPRPRTANKIMGYLGLAAAAVAVVSGLWVTWEALFGRRITPGWDTAHLASTYVLLAFALPHVVVVAVRDRFVGVRGQVASLLAAERRALYVMAVGALAMALPGVLLYGVWPGATLDNRFPDGYTLPYGPDRPFAPSLARTTTGGAYDARSLAGSESCGTTRCHEQIAAEWSVSAHRWSSMDAAFQRIQTEMAKQNGAESTRYCGGCHDPISLFSGTKNIFIDDLTGLAGYNEGVSCLSCHAVRKTDLQGNANYEMAQPDRYLFELADGPASRFMRDFLIRAYPKHHNETLSKRLFKTPEYCAACHKQFIDQEVNNVGWVQLQNQYDNWRKSRWNHPGDPAKTIECRECHMPLVASTDPAAGDEMDYNRTASDGMHRSHRFVGANQLMPALLPIPGVEEQIALTEKWLRGEYEIPEIKDKWAAGPAVSLELVGPPTVTAGEQVGIKAVITSNKVGHDFPTGPLDIIQAWVELRVEDEQGQVVFESGSVDERHFIQTGSFMFKAEPVDQYGNLIDRHNLWEMVGVRYRRSLFPGFSDTASYSFRCPGDASLAAGPTEAKQDLAFVAPSAAGRLHVKARLLYRKADQYLLNFMFGEDSGLTSPVTEMAVAETIVSVAESRVAATIVRPPVP